MKCDVIVIGAGPSGSVISAYLAKQAGKKVVTFEKNNLIGGPKFGGYFIEGGWHADLTHIAVTTVRDNGGENKGGWLLPIAEELGAGFKWQFFINYGICAGDNIMRQPSVTSAEEFVNHLRSIMPIPIEGKTAEDLANAFNAMKDMPESKLWSEEAVNTPFWDFLKDYITDPMAKRILEGMIAQTMCVPPEGVLEKTNITGVVGSSMSLWRGDTNMISVLGGVDQIPRAFFKVATDNGAELHLSTPVKNIIIEDGKAKGVVVIKDGAEVTYLADQVVVATEYPAFSSLFGDNLPASIKATVDMWDEDPIVDLDIHYGLPEKFFNLPYSFVSMVDDEGRFECLVGTMPEYGNGFQPEGKQIVQLQTFMKKTKYDLMSVEEHEQLMIKAIERKWPDFGKAVAKAEYRHAQYSYNPFAYEHDPRGAIPFKCTGIDNLFFCGSTTYGYGSCTERAVSSAARLYKEVMSK